MGEMKKKNQNTKMYCTISPNVGLTLMLGLQIIAFDMDLKKGHRVHRGLPCLSLHSEMGGNKEKGGTLTSLGMHADLTWGAEVPLATSPTSRCAAAPPLS